MSDSADLDAVATSEALAAGSLTSAAATAALLERAERLQPELNCFIHLNVDGARRQAAASDRRRARGRPASPFDGVALAVKDNIAIAGLPHGNGMSGATLAEADAAVVARLRDAGMVILGTVNMHEGALGATTDNPHHGRTHNPRRHGFTPGGSSGGSAAAVAAGLCPVALGTDTMGSVRLPAAYCGIVGFKPTRGIVSTDGVAPLSWLLDHVGPLARSVRDIEAVLPLMADQPLAPTPPREDLAGLRIAHLAEFAQVEAEPEVGAAFAASLALLRRLGAEVVERSLSGYAPTQARRAGLLISEAEAAAAMAETMATQPERFSPSFRDMLAYGRDVAATPLALAYRTVREVGEAACMLFDEVDLIVSPTTPQTAFAFGANVPVNQADFTALANFAGCPAVSLPCAISNDGLPIGLQIMGRPRADSLVLTAARVAESALRPVREAP